MKYRIIVGTTLPLRFQLLEAGSPIDLTDATVTLILSDKDGATVTNPGTVTITDEATGKIQLDPTDVNVFVAASGPYQARWKVEDTNGDFFYVPNSNERDIWDIIGV